MKRFLFEMKFFLTRLKGPYLITACSVEGIYGIAPTGHYLFPSESGEEEFVRKVALHRISHLVCRCIHASYNRPSWLVMLSHITMPVLFDLVPRKCE